MSGSIWLQLAMMGVLVSALPLLTIWVSKDTHKYRQLIWVTLFLTFDLVVFGAFTRLTDSGLGCPDWPGCYGQANPFQAHADIYAAQTMMPNGPVTVTKAWIEMIHRYLAMGVGVLITVSVIVAWIKRATVRVSPWLPTGILVFVCIQGAFGAWTVTQKLQPLIVTGHLLLGLILLILLTVLAEQASINTEHRGGNVRALFLRIPVFGALLLLIIQSALGGWVSTNYATLACTEFPLCSGVWLPQMDFSNGFTLWRALGKTGAGAYLSMDALTAIHWVHRGVAWLVLGWVIWIMIDVLKIPTLRRYAHSIMGGLLIQCATGLMVIFLHSPLMIALMHTAGAAFLIVSMTMLHCRIRTVV